MNLVPRTRHKYEALAAELRKKVLTLSSGSRLPSVRSLMKRYGVSLQTVNAAVEILEADHLVSTKRGSGIYVSDHRQVRLVAFHRSRHSTPVGDAIEASLRKAIEDQGWYLETRRQEAFDQGTFSASLVPEAKACTHIVAPDLAHLRQSFIERLKEQQVPILLCGAEIEEEGIDFIASDEALGVELLLRHLIERGHRRLGFLANEPLTYPEVRTRADAFLAFLEKAGLPEGTVVDCGTKPGEFSSTSAYNTVHRYLGEHARNLPFTGLLIASAAGGLGALRAFHEHDIEIPESCSVAVTGTEHLNSLSIPSLTAAGTLMRDWGVWAVKVLSRRFDGDVSPSIGYRLPVTLTSRESTAAAPA